MKIFRVEGRVGRLFGVVMRQRRNRNGSQVPHCTESIPGVGRPEEGKVRRGRQCIQIQRHWVECWYFFSQTLNISPETQSPFSQAASMLQSSPKLLNLVNPSPAPACLSLRVRLWLCLPFAPVSLPKDNGASPPLSPRTEDH